MADYFEYSEVEITYLIKKDKKLGALIERLGKLQRNITPDPFAALVESVIGQQISGKAADTVCKRVHEATGSLTPENVLKIGEEALQGCGMSLRKANYIMGIAQSDIDFSSLHTLTDEQIITQLTALKGIGRWTVEMLLIFSFNRPDVISYDDLGIRRGLMRLYNHKKLTKEQFLKYRKRYSPYGSVASLYLWELAGEPDNL